MFSAIMLLLAVFLFGLGVGYRLTIIGLNTWLKEVDKQDQIERLKQLTGYKRGQD